VIARIQSSTLIVDLLEAEVVMPANAELVTKMAKEMSRYKMELASKKAAAAVPKERAAQGKAASERHSSARPQL
jgi:hypothetical protein